MIIADVSLATLEPTDKTEIMLSVAPGLAADLLGGSFWPGSIVGALEKALDQLRRWRQRRRISFFNTGKKEAARIKNQLELLEKAFGRSLTPRQTKVLDVGRFLTKALSLHFNLENTFCFHSLYLSTKLFAGNIS